MKRLMCLLLMFLWPLTALGEGITPEPLYTAPPVTPEPVLAEAPEVTLRIAGGNSAVYDAFQRTYPDVGIEYTWDSADTAQAIISALMTRDATYDLMQFNTSGVDIAKIVDQGYALDLSGSETIRAYVDSLYPALRDMVSRDGKIYAVPLHLFSNDGGCYPDNFEALGLEVPASWQELAALINAWPEQPDDVLEAYEINEWTTDYRRWFLRKMTVNYATYMEATGQALHFDTPLYRELVSLVETMTTANDTEEERDVIALMGNGYIELFQQGYTWDTPLLDLAIEGRVTHTVEVFLVMVNPYAEHAEEAMRCIEFMVDQIGPATRQTMVDAAYVTPVENPDYPRLVAEWEAEKERLEQGLADCAEADRLEAQEDMERHEASWAWIESSQWLVSEESIPAYAKVFETLYFPRPSVLDAKDENDPYARSIVETLQNRYLDGQIDMDAYIREMESRIQMVIMERGE